MPERSWCCGSRQEGVHAGLGSSRRRSRRECAGTLPALSAPRLPANPCLADFWFHCPCHQSQYDRLGTKALGTGYGPAPRGMDRFAVEVDAVGALTIDTGRITLGPLPVALGRPGLIPPLVPRGCG